MKKIINVIFMLFFSLSTALAHHPSQHLGSIHFPTSGKYLAQPFFENGMMLLHSFEYAEARAQFQKARRIDPNFALAYWGEAMTYNHPLWAEQDIVAARKVLIQLASHITKISLKERELIQAIQVLYGDGEKSVRDNAYADAMRRLYQKLPEDDEIASLYALALLGTTSQRDFQTYMQAAAIVDEIFSRNPMHPGALHYAIHSYDDPVHAPLGLRAARAYAKVAPDASHALHMPSHIYLALGLWDEVIHSNQAAWNAGVKQNPNFIAKNFTLDDLHALEWLSYAYLQKQNYKRAFELTKIMETIAVNTQSSMAKWYYALMRAAYINESKDFNASLLSLDMINIELSARAANLYINGMISLNKNNVAKAKYIQQELLSIISKSDIKDTHKDYFISITQEGIKSAKIVLLELRAAIAMQEGHTKDALLFLEQALDLEKTNAFGYGPPIPVQPVVELLANYYAEEKQYDLAYKLYLASLKKMPHRFLSAQGVKSLKNKFSEREIKNLGVEKTYFNKLM